MPNAPRVSICIPSYNHAKYLPAAIESVLAQTYEDFELVIVDDGSADNSLEIAQSYAERYPSKVRVFTHPGHANRGISETVNYAYSLTRGEFWSGVPSDDLLYPDKLARQVEFLDARPGIGWVYAYADFIDEAGRLLEGPGFFGSDITQDPEPLHRLIESNAIPGMTVLMRRSCTEAVGFHDTELVYSDWEFWVRMLSHAPAGFIDQPLAKYRMHDYNTSLHADQLISARRGLEVLNSLKRKSPSIGGKLAQPRTQALLELQCALHLFLMHDEAEASSRLRSSFEADPALAREPAFFSRWLRARLHELLYMYEAGAPERDFPSWMLRNLPAIADKSVTRRVAAAAMANAAFSAIIDNPSAVRGVVIRSLLNDPSWITDKEFRAVLIRSLAGSRLVGGARHLKSLFHGHG